jgi:hypothetical protein
MVRDFSCGFLNTSTPFDSYYSLLIRMYLPLKCLNTSVLAKSNMERREYFFCRRSENYCRSMKQNLAINTAK